MNTTPDEKTIARKFTTANPIEFDFYNEDDEQVLFITDDDKQLKTLTLELKNTSPNDIELQTPDSNLKLKGNEKELAWDKWVARKDLYHFQLSFRPGVLSEKAKGYLKHPAYRLAALAEGWDLQYDLDTSDLTDWVSLLWLGEARAKKLTGAIQNNKLPHPTDLDAVLNELRESRKKHGSNDVSAADAIGLVKQGVRKLLLPKLSAAAGGGARGTRLHLNYRHLVYKDRKKPIPRGTRTQFLNIVNHQGKQYIPLHVGFVGSNTILNDGKTANELSLRITNISNSDAVTFKNTPASRFTVSFDIDDAEPWALTKTVEAAGIQIEWDGTPKLALKRLDASSKQIELTVTPASGAAWKPEVSFQGERPSWSFTYSEKTEHTLGPGQSIELKLSELKSSSPTGYTNLYLHYEDIPGYWDGQIVCLIEKAPLVFRRVVETDEQEKQEHYDRLGVGTDVPRAKLHIDVAQENKTHAVGKEESAAVFMGGNVGIGTTAPAATIDVSGNVNIKSAPSGTNTALYVENPSPDGNTALFVSGVDDRFSHIHHGENGDWYIRSAKTSGKVILQDSGGNVSIGTAEANSKLTVAGGEKQEIVAEFKSSRDAGIMVESGKESEPYIGFRKQKVTPEDIDSAWMVGIDHKDQFAIAFGVGEITEKREAHMAGTIPWEWRYVPGKKGNEKLTISSAGDVVIPGTLEVKDTISNQNLRERHEIPNGNFNRKISKEFLLTCKADILLLVQFDKLRASTEQLAEITMKMDGNSVTKIDAQLHFHHKGAYAYLSPSLHHLEQNVKAGSHTIELQHSIPTTEFKSCLLTIIQL